MKLRWSGHILVAACAMTLAAGELAAAPEPLTVDDVLGEMSKKTSSVKDFRATIRKTRYDSVFEETSRVRLELFYKKPDLERLDTHKTVKGKEVHTTQVIIGKDFILRVWPQNRHGERRRVDPKEMKRRREDWNDPLTFFSRKPDDLKEDFNVELRRSQKAGTVKLLFTPKTKKVKFDYASIELVGDTRTWMPTSIKATSKDGEDWSLYEFKKVKVNSGLKDSDFQPPAGITIEEVREEKARRPKPE